MARITSRDILHMLDNQTFGSFKELQTAVLNEFNKHVLDFPPGYTYKDVLDRGFENGWIKEHKSNSYSIQVDLLDFDKAAVEKQQVGSRV